LGVSDYNKLFRVRGGLVEAELYAEPLVAFMARPQTHAQAFF